MKSKKVNKKKKILFKLEADRKRWMNLLVSRGELIEGSLSDLLVRCGRRGCHCEKKPIHRVTRLGVREGGKIKNKVVRVDDRKWVYRLIENYKKHKDAIKGIAQLNQDQRNIMKAIIRLKNRPYS